MSAAEKFWDLIHDNPTCMMVTGGADGLRGRPMHAIPDKDLDEIWFYTRLDSGKSRELEADSEVCLCFASPGRNEFVSVTGHAQVVVDRARIKDNWSTFVDAWFPEGPDGADVGMIRVDVETGEYWDGESSSVLAALKMAVASQRDETPDIGESRKVAFD